MTSSRMETGVSAAKVTLVGARADPRSPALLVVCKVSCAPSKHPYHTVLRANGIVSRECVARRTTTLEERAGNWSGRRNSSHRTASHLFASADVRLCGQARMIGSSMRPSHKLLRGAHLDRPHREATWCLSWGFERRRCCGSRWPQRHDTCYNRAGPPALGERSVVVGIPPAHAR
eukprot:scaffold37720_cov67-Phaeocystis_antarctica.AAC.23